MVLIQVFLPIGRGPAVVREELVRRTRTELGERFGGITAYLQAPALEDWSGAASGERGPVVMVEVVAEDFDRAWWSDYARTLAGRFHQKFIHVRALPVETLESGAT